jgi:hypothetical protein
LVVFATVAAGALGGCDGSIGMPGGGGSQQPGPGAGSGSGASSQINGQATDPGTVSLHRLNLAEYDNTMRDLLGLSGANLHPSATFNFPPDDRGTDFDNIADMLTLSSLHISCYNTAATRLVPAAMANAAQRALLTSCDLATGGAACARSSLAAFLPRAWRRPVSDSEIADLMALVTVATTQGDSVEVGFDLALEAALLSANFIYRPELDPTPGSMTPHPVSDYELASRLSYFLWSSMPDDALFAAAKAGNLHEPSTLGSQVARMLADPKAQALIDNFAGQWLLIRNIDSVTPDAMQFPQFTTALRAAMKTEAQSLFEQIAFHGQPADQLLTAQFAYLSDPLAQFYGLPPVGSAQAQRVDLSSSQQRRGLLSQGLFLTVTSHANITSPVLRGKFVLTELLCQSIPAPPKGVNTTLVPDPTGMLTLRQVLEGHASNPACSGCHNLMDPIGYGLENYNPIGAYRVMDGTLPVDATGTLDGQKFNGELDMSRIIGSDPRFPGCLANKLYTYALGRVPDLTNPTSLDAPTLASLTDNFTKNGLQFGQLLASIVTSPTFLTRRGIQ